MRAIDLNAVFGSKSTLRVWGVIWSNALWVKMMV